MMVDGILIKQKFDLLEAMTGCETTNKYKIYPKQFDKMKKLYKEEIFTAKEKSGCYSRNCLTNTCRALDIKI